MSPTDQPGSITLVGAEELLRRTRKQVGILNAS